MYRCHVEKRIWQDVLKTSTYTLVYHDLEMAEAPEIGDQLNDSRWYSGPLTHVVWNVDDEVFNCRVDDEAPSIDADYEYGYEFIVENALMEGWKVAQ